MKNRLKKKALQKKNIQARIRKKVSGTEERPRLAVFKSNLNMYAQVIDDDKGVTLVSASSIEKGLEEKYAKKADQAKYVGEAIASRLLEKGVEKVVFDRGGNAFHGNIKILATAAREKGLQF
ncbi:MAG: 50S ribosomal protein L18 [Planctomycetes bacterium]|nr:50S ribosomal protein L18 [Planctomycetota bacterium]